MSAGEDDDSYHDEDDEEMPDLAPLPPQHDDEEVIERPHFRYRTFSSYPPIASHSHAEEVVNPEGLPVNFNLTAQNEDLVRADFAVSMHTMGHNPPPGNEV